MKTISGKISLFLTFVYVISSLHIMFHHQVHAIIDDGELCATSIVDTHACKSNCADSSHSHSTESDKNCSHGEECNLDADFLCEKNRINLSVKANIILKTLEEYEFSTKEDNDTYYCRICIGEPIEIISGSNQLRAPPVIC